MKIGGCIFIPDIAALNMENELRKTLNCWMDVCICLGA